MLVRRLPGARRGPPPAARRDTRTPGPGRGRGDARARPEAGATGLTVCREAALALAARSPSANQMANVSLQEPVNPKHLVPTPGGPVSGRPGGEHAGPAGPSASCNVSRLTLH